MQGPVRSLVIPPAVGRYLRELVTLRWIGGDPQPVIAALPQSMPEGTVRRLASGGPFGWCIAARLDEIDGRLALEALEDDRMSGPCHYRVWDDGTREELPNEHIAYGVASGAPPDEVERAQAAYHAHNRAVQQHLRERGFLGS
jgi:hypothetical protein